MLLLRNGPSALCPHGISRLELSKFTYKLNKKNVKEDTLSSIPDRHIEVATF